MAELKRTLGLFDAFAIGIGAIVGSGIFVVTGIAAGLAGPALLISLIIGAFISGFTALLTEIIRQARGIQLKVQRFTGTFFQGLRYQGFR